MDHTDTILNQWRRERPDLDASSMAITGRVKRLSLFFGGEMEKTFHKFHLNTAKFDVLATLRRAGSPYSLSPGDLIASAMVTSGTMTNRLDQLEKVGFITRKKNRDDKRGFLISLTKKGVSVIDTVIEEHIKTIDGLTAMLSQQDKKHLANILKKMALHFESHSK